MTKSKPKKIKQEKYRSEEQEEMIRFIRILIIVIIVILGIYFFTRIFVTKDLLNKEEDNTPITEGTINYTMTLIGSMLNKPEEEYYVIIYNADDIRSVYYSGLISNYNRNEDALTVYYANLANELNKKFYAPDNMNLETTNISDLRVGDLTLIKVESGKIAKIFESEEDIAEKLAYIESEDAKN